MRNFDHICCLQKHKLPTFILATGLSSHIKKQGQLKSQCHYKDLVKLYPMKLSGLKHRMDISSHAPVRRTTEGVHKLLQLSGC